MSKNALSGSVYLDTDPILAVLKADDWLASTGDLETIDEPKTSVATSGEIPAGIQTRGAVQERLVDLRAEWLDEANGIE